MKVTIDLTEVIEALDFYATQPGVYLLLFFALVFQIIVWIRTYIHL